MPVRSELRWRGQKRVVVPPQLIVYCSPPGVAAGVTHVWMADRTRRIEPTGIQRRLPHRSSARISDVVIACCDVPRPTPRTSSYEYAPKGDHAPMLVALKKA